MARCIGQKSGTGLDHDGGQLIHVARRTSPGRLRTLMIPRHENATTRDFAGGLS